MGRISENMISHKKERKKDNKPLKEENTLKDKRLTESSAEGSCTLL